MRVGDKITFPFGKGQMEGTVHKIFPKTIYIKVDFPRHKGKLVKRSIMTLQMKETKKKEPKKDRKKKKETPEKSTA